MLIFNIAYLSFLFNIQVINLGVIPEIHSPRSNRLNRIQEIYACDACIVPKSTIPYSSLIIEVPLLSITAARIITASTCPLSAVLLLFSP